MMERLSRRLIGRRIIFMLTVVAIAKCLFAMNHHDGEPTNITVGTAAYVRAPLGSSFGAALHRRVRLVRRQLPPPAQRWPRRMCVRLSLPRAYTREVTRLYRKRTHPTALELVGVSVVYSLLSFVLACSGSCGVLACLVRV